MKLDWSNYDLAKAKELGKKSIDLVLGDMARNLHAMDLVDKSVLLNSLKGAVTTKDSVVDSLTFSYEWYGFLWENGASNVFGKGVDLTPKHWRSEAINAHIEQIDLDYAELYAQMIVQDIIDALENPNL